MKKENKSSKSKYTLVTLVICILAVLSGKPIGEVLDTFTAAQEVTYEADSSYEDEAQPAEQASAKEETKPQEDSKPQQNATAKEESKPQENTSAKEESKPQENTSAKEETKPADTKKEEAPEAEISFNDASEVSDHSFRSKKLLNDHYKKHGLEMGFDSPEEYVENANRVISSPDVLYKLEEEDQDHVYYLEETNEFVVVSQDGYIRTYFNPSAGIDYFNRQ